jgi:hypothetical protein
MKLTIMLLAGLLLSGCSSQERYSYPSKIQKIVNESDYKILCEKKNGRAGESFLIQFKLTRDRQSLLYGNLSNKFKRCASVRIKSIVADEIAIEYIDMPGLITRMDRICWPNNVDSRVGKDALYINDENSAAMVLVILEPDGSVFLAGMDFTYESFQTPP